jgi:uncharacterized protein (DUF1810 family)
LTRFIDAQHEVYDTALSELRAGRKQSHWMWFIFPQFAGLGSSETSQFYAIKSIPEAQAYLKHPTLGPRLIESTEALLALHDRSAHDIFGSPDDIKLRSCMTLFASITPRGFIFDMVIDRYFNGERDVKTLSLLAVPRL